MGSLKSRAGPNSTTAIQRSQPRKAPTDDEGNAEALEDPITGVEFDLIRHPARLQVVAHVSRKQNGSPMGGFAYLNSKPASVLIGTATRRGPVL